MTTTTPPGGWRMPSTDADAALFDMALDLGSAEALPQRLRELASLATQLAAALRVSSLTVEERARIEARTAELLRRRRRARLLGLGDARRRPAVVAGAGGAVVGLVVVGLALLRRPHPVIHPA
jgi:hypothetical protein